MCSCTRVQTAAPPGRCAHRYLCRAGHTWVCTAMCRRHACAHTCHSHGPGLPPTPSLQHQQLKISPGMVPAVAMATGGWGPGPGDSPPTTTSPPEPQHLQYTQHSNPPRMPPAAPQHLQHRQNPLQPQHPQASAPPECSQPPTPNPQHPQHSQYPQNSPGENPRGAPKGSKAGRRPPGGLGGSSVTHCPHCSGGLRGPLIPRLIIHGAGAQQIPPCRGRD